MADPAPPVALILRWTARAAAWFFAALGVVTLLYMMCANIGGGIAANPDWEEPSQGVTIFVETNGVHTGLILPRGAAGVDWTEMLPAAHLADPRYGDPRWATHLSFGWGQRDFYLETATWADIKPSTLFAVLVGGDETLVHVAHEHDPQPGKYLRPLRISAPQYRKLAGLIEARFAHDADGAISAPILGYHANDVFYEGVGNYTPFYTCNAWTGDVLRAIGVRVGKWTPLESGVMRWFPTKLPSRSREGNR